MVSFLKAKIKGNTKGNTNKCMDALCVLFYCNFGGNSTGNRRYLDGILAVLPSFFMPQYKQREG